jgi:hypothetical protein
MAESLGDTRHQAPSSAEDLLAPAHTFCSAYVSSEYRQHYTKVSASFIFEGLSIVIGRRPESRVWQYTRASLLPGMFLFSLLS